MPFLLVEILNYQGSAHLIGVGSLSYETYIQIKWDKHGGANKYAIYRSNSSTESGVFLTDALSAQDTYYNDKNIITGKTYYYKVQAISTDGKESNLNDTISVKGQALPSAPSVKSIYFDSIQFTHKYPIHTVYSHNQKRCKEIEFLYSLLFCRIGNYANFVA